MGNVCLFVAAGLGAWFPIGYGLEARSLTQGLLHEVVQDLACLLKTSKGVLVMSCTVMQGLYSHPFASLPSTGQEQVSGLTHSPESGGETALGCENQTVGSMDP